MASHYPQLTRGHMGKVTYSHMNQAFHDLEWLDALRPQLETIMPPKRAKPVPRLQIIDTVVYDIHDAPFQSGNIVRWNYTLALAVPSEDNPGRWEHADPLQLFYDCYNDMEAHHLTAGSSVLYGAGVPGSIPQGGKSPNVVYTLPRPITIGVHVSLRITPGGMKHFEIPNAFAVGCNVPPPPNPSLGQAPPPPLPGAGGAP